MTTVDEEWEKFCENEEQFLPQNSILETAIKTEIPKCGDIYISTKTKIAYLNQNIPLLDIFWKIPVIKYYIPTEGVIKKQIKINNDKASDVEALEKKLSTIENCNVDIISQINNPNARKIKYKDVRKINIGISKKDLTTYRKKKRGAFYNCFVLIIRLLYQEKFKEIHVKVFNTGKLEIPGIQHDDLLILTLNRLVQLLNPHCPKILSYNLNDIQTVLINSNFDCGFEIDRDKFYNILKYTYNLNVTYDPCSYPGIQCKYYYNEQNKQQNGICHCNTKCTKKGTGLGAGQCKEISFMIFRTGSVLIVGNCTEHILYIIYNFLKKLFKNEYSEVSISPPPLKAPKKKKRLRKKKIFIKTESN